MNDVAVNTDEGQQKEIPIEWPRRLHPAPAVYHYPVVGSMEPRSGRKDWPATAATPRRGRPQFASGEKFIPSIGVRIVHGGGE